MSFPDDIVFEILSWLPVKSLMRFKCASKTWFRLISTDPRFINLHHTRSLIKSISSDQNPSLIISRADHGVIGFYYAEDYTACNEAVRIEIPFSDRFRFVNICHGLVCVYDIFQKEVYVWNPRIKDHISIPCPPIPSQFDLDDPCGLTDIMFGFGFCEDRNEYKVVRLVSTATFEHYDEFHSLVSVYTLGSGSWRNLEEDVMQYNMSLASDSTVLVSGALHWYASKPFPSHRYSHEILVSFNLRDETFQEIPQPDGIKYPYPYDTIVGELGGCLSIFCRLQGEYIEIWLMKEYGVIDSWTKQFMFGKPEVPGSIIYLTPIGFANNGQIITMKNQTEIILYDPIANSIRDLNKFEFEVGVTSTCTATLFSPTLIDGATCGTVKEENQSESSRSFQCSNKRPSRRGSKRGQGVPRPSRLDPRPYEKWLGCLGGNFSMCGSLSL